jgi:hypothetical protein
MYLGTFDYPNQSVLAEKAQDVEQDLTVDDVILSNYNFLCFLNSSLVPNTLPSIKLTDFTAKLLKPPRS